MMLTKFTHSCVRLEKDGKVLVFDPGNFSETDVALAGADAVLITHEHPDHIDVDAVTAALWPEIRCSCSLRPESQRNCGRRRPTPGTGSIRWPPARTSRRPGSPSGARGQHAVIHPQIPVVANIGYFVDANVYHPGDSFIVPDGVAVRTLLVPIHAPWNKVGEVVDFVIGVRAPKAFPIHDALLNDNGRGLVEGHVTRFGAKYGTEYRHLSSGDTVEV